MAGRGKRKPVRGACPWLRPATRPKGFRREQRQQFWRLIAQGVTSEEAAPMCGVSSPVGTKWFRDSGGMPSVDMGPVSGRYLSFAEREEIAVLNARQAGVREIARRLGRSPSTIDGCRAHAGTVGILCPDAPTSPTRHPVGEDPVGVQAGQQHVSDLGHVLRRHLARRVRELLLGLGPRLGGHGVGGLRFITRMITRACSGDTVPSACNAAVVGNRDGPGSPQNDLGRNEADARTRAPAADRRNTSIT